MIEVPVEDSLVYIFQFSVSSALLFRRLFEHSGCQRRYESESNHKAGAKGKGQGQSHIAEELSGETLYENDGREYTDSGQSRRNDGGSYFFGSCNRSTLGIYAQTAQSEDVLDDNYGVVHQHTYRHSETRQGDQIDGDP